MTRAQASERADHARRITAARAEWLRLSFHVCIGEPEVDHAIDVLGRHVRHDE